MTVPQCEALLSPIFSNAESAATRIRERGFMTQALRITFARFVDFPNGMRFPKAACETCGSCSGMII